MPRIDERTYKALKLLDRRGGDYTKPEKQAIAQVIKDLAVLANGEVGPTTYFQQERAA